MRDKKLILFAVLNLIQGSLVGSFALTVPSSSYLLNGILAGAALMMLISAPVLVFATKVGVMISAIACCTHFILGTVFAALISGSASYMYEVFGSHGRMLGIIAFLIALLGIVIFWLIPLHELAYLRKRRAQI